MVDDMIFSEDEKSLMRGRRREPRTRVCRPCLIWEKGEASGEDERRRGVVLDVSPHGMRIRTMDDLPLRTPLMVQMMRDEDFHVPLSLPVEGCAVRCVSEEPGFTDHGLALTQRDIKRAESQPVHVRPRTPLVPRPRTRMYTIDYTVGDKRKRR